MGQLVLGSQFERQHLGKFSYVNLLKGKLENQNAVVLMNKLLSFQYEFSILFMV